jgi:hypothetical protein
MALLLLLLFTKRKKPLPGSVTVFCSLNFRNRPSPNPYGEGNNNPANYNDLYGTGAVHDSFHKYPLQKSGLQLTVRFLLVKRIFFGSWFWLQLRAIFAMSSLEWSEAPRFSVLPVIAGNDVT